MILRPVPRDFISHQTTAPYEMFNPNTVAQMAAFFAAREPGGEINRMKLMKLMYLADREFMRRHGGPISYDNMVSMPNGPVPLRTLHLSYGRTGKYGEIWNKWMVKSARNELAPKRKFRRGDLDYISVAEFEVLNDVWQKFGAMTQWELRDYTHDSKNCPEWQDPVKAGVNSIPIDEEIVLRAVGMNKRAARACAEEIESAKYMERYFARS